MALLLTASVAAADVPTPPAKRTVRFAPVSSTERLRALIQAEINQFTDRRWRFVTFVHDANADFDYSDLHTESHGSSRLQLVANVKERSGTSHRVNSAWLDWDGSARSLFYELMEKTLFNEEQGVYRPLRIESCSIAGMLVRVSVVPDPGNGPFDS